MRTAVDCVGVVDVTTIVVPRAALNTEPSATSSTACTVLSSSVMGGAVTVLPSAAVPLADMDREKVRVEV